MYQFQYIDQDGYCWFVADGNQIYEVASYFQSGLLKRQSIISNRFSTKLEVGLRNPHNFKFKEANYYNLYLANSSVVGYVDISLVFNSDEYVARWYKPLLTEYIKPETWLILFHRQYLPRYDYSEDDKQEYNDYTSYLDYLVNTKDYFSDHEESWDDQYDKLNNYQECNLYNTSYQDEDHLGDQLEDQLNTDEDDDQDQPNSQLNLEQKSDPSNKQIKHQTNKTGIKITDVIKIPIMTAVVC